MIQDSGNRREFETGAVRDIVEGKGRCDLLPLSVVCELFECEDVNVNVALYLSTLYECIDLRDIAKLDNLLLIFADKEFDSLVGALLEVSVHFEDGAKKYGERNWEKGIPAHSYVDSAIRHLLKYSRGDDDERHDRAFFWNIMCLRWTLRFKPEMNDLWEDVNDKDRKC